MAWEPGSFFMVNFFYYFYRELFLLPLRPGSRAHYDVTISTATVTGAGFLIVALQTTTDGFQIAQVAIWIPLTAGFTALAAAGQALNKTIAVDFGPGGFNVPAAATGPLTVTWTVAGITMSALTGAVAVAATY